MFSSQSQESDHRTDKAPDWLHRSEQPIRRQPYLLTELLTLTKTHKFPFLGEQRGGGQDEQDTGDHPFLSKHGV